MSAVSLKGRGETHLRWISGKPILSVPAHVCVDMRAHAPVIVRSHTHTHKIVKYNTVINLEQEVGCGERLEAATLNTKTGDFLSPKTISEIYRGTNNDYFCAKGWL